MLNNNPFSILAETVSPLAMQYFIVAMILFSLGSGSVKGFAITLTIGLLASMLTSIYFTRAIIDMIYNKRSDVKSLSIGI